MPIEPKTFDKICNITRDQPWKNFLDRLDVDQLKTVAHDARQAGDMGTANYAEELLKKCSSTTTP